MKQGDAEWHDLRDSCAITWSEAANALGIGYDSRIMYMRRKLGLIPKKEPNWRMLEGQEREPWAAELYYRIMGWCNDDVTLYTDSFKRDPVDHRMGGSLDRIVESLKTGERWLLEIKTCPAGDMRTSIPISHIVQMFGLCHTYNFNKAHYLCWSSSKGILLAEVTWHPQLWSLLYPRFKAFADLWALRLLPDRMPKEEAEQLTQLIRRCTFVTEIPCVSTKRQRLQQLQISASTYCLHELEHEEESACEIDHPHFPKYSAC